jgi:hypothetical protein
MKGMIAGKARVQETKLAESCRVALEKSFGMPVPLPNCLSKKNPGNR